MKKTLITLMALASCAMGETTPTITLADATAVLNKNTTSYAFEVDADSKTTSAYVVFSLSASALTTYQSTDVIDKAFVSFSISGNNNSNYVGLADTKRTSNNKSANYLRIERAQAGTNSSSFWSSTISRDTDAMQASLADAEAITLCLGSSSNGSAQVILSMIDATGEVKHLGTWSKTGMDAYTAITGAAIDSSLVESAYVFSGSYTEDGLKGLSAELLKSTVSVPEPATATLSLLALCGLAARRRRK